MNRLSVKKQVQVLKHLCEGSSVNSTCRLVEVAKNTVFDLILETGWISQNFQERTLRSLPCKRVECDEIWAFCYSKEKNVPDKFKGMDGYGSVWTYTAVCPNSRLVIAWRVGKRCSEDTTLFMQDLESRLYGKVQLTTDGYTPYPEAVYEVFGGEVDFATLVKTYSGKGKRGVLTIEKKLQTGSPDPSGISTSKVERQNLSMRMGMRRYTRKTNGNSRKIEYHRSMLAIYFMYHNFIRVNGILKTTPAVAIGITNRSWKFEELLGMLG